MDDFFYGRRRKAGLLALFLALAFMSGWLRSVVVRDYVEIANGRFKSNFAMSTDNFFVGEASLMTNLTIRFHYTIGASKISCPFMIR